MSFCLMYALIHSNQRKVGATNGSINTCFGVFRKTFATKQESSLSKDSQYSLPQRRGKAGWHTQEDSFILCGFQVTG